LPLAVIAGVMNLVQMSLSERSRLAGSDMPFAFADSQFPELTGGDYVCVPKTERRKPLWLKGIWGEKRVGQPLSRRAV